YARSARNPVLRVLGTLPTRIGLPFFVVSAGAPLLQRWFATLPVPSSRDPYFLYAASNAGSMLALRAWPFLLEPSVGVVGQTWLWGAGYVALLVLLAGCAALIRRFGQDGRSESVGTTAHESLPIRTRLAWVAFSLVPSSL